MKRAQMIGQVFTFVLAGLVFVLIVVYGYKAVTNLNAKTSTVVLVDIEGSIHEAVEAIRLDYGSERQLVLRVPKNYKEICFVTDANSQELRASHPIIAEAAQGASQNIFLVPMATKPMHVDGIDIEGGCHCSKSVNGIVTLRLVSLGNRVQVSDWNLGRQC